MKVENRLGFRFHPCFLVGFFLVTFCHPPVQYDLIIRNGIIYDGTGSPPYQGDLGITNDTIAALGNLGNSIALQEIDINGLAVAPGFINVLSWATRSLIEDGSSQSNIRQGVTVEVFGEGYSYGPFNDEMKQELKDSQGDIKFDVNWTTLHEYLEFLVARGVSPNVASFVGASTVRQHVLGMDNRPPTPRELEEMKELVRKAMEDGALGLGSALIYTPGQYADTQELIELAKIAGEYDGVYISHLRSEGDRLLEAINELITIARQAGIAAEIYHLKALGKPNWSKLDEAIALIEKARNEGLNISADMYSYTAAATGLDAAMPPWVQEGGRDKWIQRLKDPVDREKVVEEMKEPSPEWESFYLAAGSPENVLLIGFKNDSLKKYTGNTLAEVASILDQTPEETAIDLVIADHSRVEVVYFVMSEENISRKIALPWVSFGSDEASLAPEGNFLKSNPHPRAYGNFARVLGKYVREEKIIPMEEAIRKMTSMPAQTLNLSKRGKLESGYFADIVVFDTSEIKDNSTYSKPHQYSTGVMHVFVNGVQVLDNGIHTGEKPGRILKGPGYDEGSE